MNMAQQPGNNRNNPQLATPSSHRRRSEQLAYEAEDGSSGMDMDSGSPTPMPRRREAAYQDAQEAQQHESTQQRPNRQPQPAQEVDLIGMVSDLNLCYFNVANYRALLI